MTHGHGNGQWCGDCLREWGDGVEGDNEGKCGTTVIVQTIKYNFKKEKLKIFESINNCYNKRILNTIAFLVHK